MIKNSYNSIDLVSTQIVDTNEFKLMINLIIP